MSDILKRMLKEFGISIGFILVQMLQKRLEKNMSELNFQYVSSEIPLISVQDNSSNRTPD